MKSEILVSIRCLVYNHEPFLRRCLDGFVMQKTNFKFEAIVHDDCSTDNSAAIIHEYAKKYPDIIKPIFESVNQYSKNDDSLRKIMDSACTGKYIALCEGDDYWIDPFKLQKQVDILENDNSVGMVRTNVDFYYHDLGRFEKGMMEKTPYNRIQDTFKDYLLNGWFNAPMTTVWRRDIKGLETCQKDIYTGSNLPRILTILQQGYKIVYIPDVTAVYRVLKNSASHFDSFEKSYSFFQKSRLVQYDFCKNQSVWLKMRLLFKYSLIRFRLILRQVLKLLFVSVKDTFNDFVYVIKK